MNNVSVDQSPNIIRALTPTEQFQRRHGILTLFRCDFETTLNST